MEVSRQRHSPGANEGLFNRHLDTLEQSVTQLVNDANNQSSVELVPQNFEGNFPSNSLADAVPFDPLESPLTSWESFEWMSWDWNEVFPQD